MNCLCLNNIDHGAIIWTELTNIDPGAIIWTELINIDPGDIIWTELTNIDPGEIIWTELTNIDPGAIISTMLVKVQYRMLNTKYLSSRHCSFWQEEISSFSYRLPQKPEFCIEFNSLDKFGKTSFKKYPCKVSSTSVDKEII